MRRLGSFENRLAFFVPECRSIQPEGRARGGPALAAAAVPRYWQTGA
jgi:hypothetical protein